MRALFPCEEGEGDAARADVGADDGADLREGQIVRHGGLVGGCFLGGFRLRQAVGDVLAGRRVG